MATYGYARVSTEDQNLDMQIADLKRYGCDRIYSEKVSGTRDDRPKLTAMLKALKTGDTVVVWKLDRLARSTKHLLALSERFEKDGINLVSLRDSIDTKSAQGRLYFTILAAMSEFERDMIVERTKAGLATARASGKKLGPPVRCEEQVDTARRLHEGGMSVTEACRRVGISRQTYYRWIGKKQDSETGAETGRKGKKR